MRVFVTGATGFIGSAVVDELIGAGHKVTGLARSTTGAKRLSDAGAAPHHGRIEDLDALRAAAKSADAVIHLAFFHKFSDASLAARLAVMARGIMGKGIVASFMATMMKADMGAIDTLGGALAGSGRPFIVTVGTMGLASGRLATEEDAPDPLAPGAARSVPSEARVMELAAQGVRASVMRLPPSVHGDGDHGLIPALIAIARKKGVSAYVGDGGNRWPAVHRLDAARLYRLALETGQPGSRFHAVADEGVPFRDIATIIGKHVGVPVTSKPQAEVARHFSWLAPFVAADNPVSGQLTQQRMNWQPTRAGLIEDIDRPEYFG